MKRLFQIFLFALVTALAAPAALAADFRVASVLVDTHANILAKAGLYAGQRAFATDFNSAAVRWNGTFWVWETTCQGVYRVRADVSAPADTADNALATYTLPKLGTEDTVRIAAFVSYSNNTNTKTLRVNLGSAGAMTAGTAIGVESTGFTNLVTEFRNQGNAAVQEWFSNNKSIFGANGGALQPTTKDTAVAGKLLTVSFQKATAGDGGVLHWLDISICGAGVP